MAVSLPEDVLLEILIRVTDVAALFRCNMACKRWCSLVVDPSFLRCRWPDQDSTSSSFVGFFAPQREGLQVPIPEPFFVPTPRSALGPGRRALNSFVTAATVSLFDKAVPLASRHGLLLVLLEADEIGGSGLDPTILHLQLAVCNLLDGTCDILPPLKYPSAIMEIEYCGYAILTSADCLPNDESVIPSNSCFFKVVIVASSYEDLTYNIHTFRSDKRSWKAHTDCLNSIVIAEEHGLFGNVVVRRGTAHWQFSGVHSLSIINMNTRTDCIYLTRLPFLRDNRLTSPNSLTLGVNGTLSLLLIQNTCPQIQIWERLEDKSNVDDTNSVWQWSRTIELKQPWDTSEERKLRVIGEKCGTMVMQDSYEHVYTVDLETGRMEALDWPRKCGVNQWKVVPVAMDWPTLFVSRLCARYR